MLATERGVRYNVFPADKPSGNTCIQLTVDGTGRCQRNHDAVVVTSYTILAHNVSIHVPTATDHIVNHDVTSVSKADTHSGSLPSGIGGRPSHPLGSGSQSHYESYCKIGKNANNSAGKGSVTVRLVNGKMPKRWVISFPRLHSPRRSTWRRYEYLRC